MIVLDLKLKNILGFSNFEINFSYPKKAVGSIIENEHLSGRPNFRYKKVVLLTGANATGKTSLGKALSRIFKYLESGNSSLLTDITMPGAIGHFSIDFVNDNHTLHRVCGTVGGENAALNVMHSSIEIGKRDSYEKCVLKLPTATRLDNDVRTLKATFGELKYRFAYPEIESTLRLSEVDRNVLLKVFRAVIGTLDPTLTDISISKDLRDSYIIRRGNAEIIVQDGKLLCRDILSSGTAEGVDISIFLASIMSTSNGFYYCDEHFSYIQTDIEKRVFGIMIDHLKEDEQLIFTTHNTDMLDLNLPKHSFAFLCRRASGDGAEIFVTYASDVLKRNTDSVRCAFENDVFMSIPNDSLLDTLEVGWDDE